MIPPCWRVAQQISGRSTPTISLLTVRLPVTRFRAPAEKLYELVEQAKAMTSGLGKRVRLVMSHVSGKIEILAIEKGKAYLKYHQSRDNAYGKFVVLDCPDNAAWFDDLPGNEQYWDKPTDEDDPMSAAS